MIDYIFKTLELYMPMWSNYLVYIVGLSLIVFLFDFVLYLIDQKYKRW